MMNAGKIVLPNAIMLGEVNNLLSEGHSVVIMTKGNSMLPFIRGDKDSVELVRQDKYAVGDIVLAQIAPGRYVLHRIIALDGEKATLKGDGNLDGTEGCRLSDICGAVEKIILPDGKEKDCRTERFSRRSAMWRRHPRIVRRYFLGFYRRIVK